MAKKPCTALIGGKEYTKEQLQAAIINGELNELLGIAKENKALSSVEETAKALEGVNDKDIERIMVRKNIKPLKDMDFEDEEANANWRKIQEEKNRLLTDNKYIDEQIKLSKEGKKSSQTVFEAMYGQDPREYKENLSKAYHRAKADGTNPELVKAVEDLLGKPEQGAGKGVTTKQEKATDKKSFADAVRKVFGLSKKKSEATATITDAIANAYERLGFGTKKDYYDRFKLQKGGAKEGSLRQINVGGKQVTVRELPENLDIINGFYSPLEKTINESKQDKLPVKQWTEKFARGEEAKWTGLTDWLSTQSGSISKQEILDYMKDNRIQIVEVVKGEDAMLNDEWTPGAEENEGTGRVWKNRGWKVVENSKNSYSIFYPDGTQMSGDWATKDGAFGRVKMEAPSGTTKFHQYQLEGEKSNYKEVLVTLPKKKIKADGFEISENDTVIYEDRGLNKPLKVVKVISKKFVDASEEASKYIRENSYKHEYNLDYNDGESVIDALEKAGVKIDKTNFESTHFEEPNILVHLRMNTRTDAQGNKVLFLEEVQSDWGQKGKKEGFENKAYSVKISNKELDGVKLYDILLDGKPIADIDISDLKKWYEKKYRETLYPRSADQNKAEIVAGRLNEALTEGKVPTAPFVTDTNAWTKLGFKYAIQHAIKEGADKIAWTTGEQQNERYDLSKQVDKIEILQREVSGEKIDSYRAKIYKDGKILQDQDYIPFKDLEGMFGKEIANKVQQGETTFEGEGLKVGGKGMIGFYGSVEQGKEGIVGGVAKALVKELTGKPTEIGETKIETERQYQVVNGGKGEFLIRKLNGQLEGIEFGNRKDAEDWIKNKQSSTQSSIDITPELKAAVEKGISLFQGEKGAYTNVGRSERIIHALSSPDVSTPVHELAHDWFDILLDAEKDGHAEAKKMVNAVTEFAGVSRAKEYTPEQYTKIQERFARGFEKYLADGTAPTIELKKVFENFKKWLTDIYNGIKGSEIDIELSDKMKDVYAKMLGKEIEITEPKPEKETMVGKTVEFEFAGSPTKGEVKAIDEKGNLKVEDKKGIKYTVKPKDATELSSQEKHYEEISASRPNANTGRTPVDPIVGGSPKKISDIVFDVTNAIKQRLFYAKPSRNRATGTYAPSSKGIKIKYDGDLDVTAHELGHSIDDMFGVISDLQNTPNPTVEAELLKYSPFGSKPPANHPNPKMYEYGEGFAEWLRAFIVNPTQAKSDAPELYRLYESKVHEEYKKSLKQFSDDIRTFAGASGRDMTLSNIEVEPSKTVGIWKEIFGDKSGSNQFEITWVDKLAANFVNPLTAFNKAFDYAKGIKGIDKVLPSDDPKILARLLSGFDGKYGSVLQDGMINGEGKLILDKNGKAKNLSWLLEPLDNTDESTIKRDIEDVMSYMVAERTVELSKKLGKESGLTGIGGGIFRDIDVAQKTIDEFNNGDPNRLLRVKEAASRYRELSDDVLKYMVEKGRIAQKIVDADGNLVGGYDFIKQNNMQYVALQRIIETEPNKEVDINFGKGGKLGSASEPIKAIQGSSKKIVNPYVSLMDTIYKGMKEADRNEVMAAFRDMIHEQRGMYQGEPKRFSDVGILGKEGDKNSITVFIDGKPEHWILQEDVYNSIKGLDETGFKFPSIITAFPKALRWTVTHFPVFAVRNIARDIQARMILSQDKSGVMDLLGDKEHWKELARSGGLNSGYYMRNRETYYGMLEETMHDISKNKKFILLDPIRFKEGWEKYQDILTQSETINRVAEYRAAFRKAKEQGMDDYNASLYAGYKSRDLMDFALMGNQMKWINQIIPFSNAAVQGLRKTAITAKDNPSGFAARLFMYSIAPSVLVWLYNHKDKEAAEEYESLPAYQRDMYYNFKTGKDTWVVIPKPYELSLPGATVDRIMSKLYGNSDAFAGYVGTLSKSTLPVDQANLIPVAPAAVEGMMNYDLFRDKSVIPPYENNLDIALRKTENASRLGKALQELSIMGGKPVDARKIDHFIKGQFSYFGQTALKLSDLGREKGGEDFNLSDFGFFKNTPAYNSPQVQEFMDYAQKWNLGRSTDVSDFNDLAKSYFEEKDKSKKDAKAKALRDYAKLTLMSWKREHKDLDKLSKKKSSTAP